MARALQLALVMFRAIRQSFTLEVDDARTIVQRTFDTYPSRNFAVHTALGWAGGEVDGPPEFIIGFKDAEAFRRCFATRDPADFAEAYVDGRASIEGDLLAATRLGSYLPETDVGLGDKLRFVPAPRPRLTPHAGARWPRRERTTTFRTSSFVCLDEKMVYSCAYFAHPEQEPGAGAGA